MNLYVTGNDIYASILLLRGSPPAKTLVLVEGPSDSACLASHIDNSLTETISCFGARNLDAAMALVDSFMVPGVIAIRDSDWFGILDAPSNSPNVVLTDLYDLDASIMLSSEIGNRLCRVFGEQSAIDRHCSKLNESSPIKIAILMAAEVGLLRLVTARHNLGLALRDFPIHEVVDSSSGLISRERMVALAIQRSSEATCTIEEVIGYMTAETVEANVRVCSGHDLAAALSVLIHRDWGGSKVVRSLILQAARSALSCAELWGLGFYSLVSDWERSTGWAVWSCRPPSVSVA